MSDARPSTPSLPSDGLLWTRWARHAERTPDREAVVHYAGGEAAKRWTWGDMVQRARFYACELRRNGIRPGDVCGLIIRHHPEFYPLYMGVEAAGAIPTVLAY